MSDRLTKEWTTDTIEAFGDTPAVRKGIVAEQMYHDWAIKVYNRVTDHSSDKTNQVRGYDFSIWKEGWRNEYGVDVKGNMYPNGKFFIENQRNGWLRNSKKTNHRVVHICPETGWAVEYDRKRMIEHLDSLSLKEDNVLMSSFDANIKHIIRKFKVN